MIYIPNNLPEPLTLVVLRLTSRVLRVAFFRLWLNGIEKYGA